MEGFTADNLAREFEVHRERLLALVRRRLNPVLLKRFSYEDVLQDTYLAAARRLDFFAERPDVPVFFKLRTILLQTLADLERRHLLAEARDAYREVEVADAPDDTDDESGGGAPGLNWGQFAADITSPASHLAREERRELLRRAIDALPEADRQIIALRHFDGLGNAECAEILGVEPKAASMRHARALEHLRRKLLELSSFSTIP